MAILRKAGFTDADIQECRDMYELCPTNADLKNLMPLLHEARERSERSVVRKLLRKRRAGY
jgi:hypothetical protein